jgi:uncharacterized protein
MAGLMYLIDSNIIIEGLLKQKNFKDVVEFFRTIDLSNLFISDFSLHSIGIILFKLKKYDVFVSFLEDVIFNGLRVISIDSIDLRKIDLISKRFNLDFDDSYQYFIAVNYNLQLISFDHDFDNTEIKRKEPSEIIKINN